MSSDKIKTTFNLNRLNKLLIGDSENLRLNNKIYIVASLIAFTAAITGLSFNIIIELSSLFNLSILFIAISYATFYLFARLKHLYFKNVFVLISQLGLAMSWYSEGGLSGPVLPLFVIAIIVFTVIADSKYHILYLFISIVNIVGLFLVEQSEYGKYIVQYPNKFYHDLDISFTLLVSVISIYLFVSYIKKVFVNSLETTAKQKKELEQLNEMKDKFFSIIAHDLRGPFNGMIELTRLMADESTGLSKEDLQDLSGKLSTSAKSTFSLLENLLNWAKMNQGMIAYNPTLIPLKSFATKHLEAMQEMANNKEIKTTNNIPNDLLVFADEYMLQTIIRNFIINAIKFTAKGGEVSISAREIDNNNIEISINDNGVGMSVETIGNLFKLDNQNQRAGTENEPSSGLGLILCKEFIDLHKGIINVESEEGKGSSFKFTLPVTHASIPG